MSDRPRLTFLVLGPPKCGTTSLTAMLASNPRVFFTDPKEPRFFEAEYERGLDYYADRYLRGWSGQRAVGEGRTYNLYLPFVPERIREALPDARLIAILRDPVDRAWSHWWHRVTRGYETRSFEQAIEDELPRLGRGERFPLRESEACWRRNFHTNGEHARELDVREAPYVEIGYYGEQIRRYLDIFPAEQLRVFRFRDLVERPSWLITEACRHVGVDPLPQYDADGVHENTALRTIKSPLAFRAEQLAWRTGVARLMPKWLRAGIRSLFPAKRATRPRMDPDVRSRLVEHFAPVNEELSTLVGLDSFTDTVAGTGIPRAVANDGTETTA